MLFQFYKIPNSWIYIHVVLLLSLWMRIHFFSGIWRVFNCQIFIWRSLLNAIAIEHIKYKRLRDKEIEKKWFQNISCSPFNNSTINFSCVFNQPKMYCVKITCASFQLRIFSTIFDLIQHSYRRKTGSVTLHHHGMWKGKNKQKNKISRHCLVSCESISFAFRINATAKNSIEYFIFTANELDHSEAAQFVNMWQRRLLLFHYSYFRKYAVK